MLTTSLQLLALDHTPTAAHHVTTAASTSLRDPYARLSELQTILYDATRACLIVLAYEGVLRVIPLGAATGAGQRRSSKASRRATLDVDAPVVLDLAGGYNVRLPALSLTALELLPLAAPAELTLALVHGNHLGERVLITYELDLEDKELVDGPIGDLVLDDAGCEKLLVAPCPVAGRDSGLVVVGERSLRWVGLDAEPAEAQDLVRIRPKVPSIRVECAMPIGSIQAYVFGFTASMSTTGVADLYWL